MCYFQGTKFYVAPDPYRKGSITGFCLFIWVSKTNPITGLVFGFWFLVFGTSNFFLFNEILTGSGKVDHLLTPGKQTPRLLIRLNRFLKIEKIEIDLIDLNRFKSI